MRTISLNDFMLRKSFLSFLKTFAWIEIFMNLIVHLQLDMNYVLKYTLLDEIKVKPVKVKYQKCLQGKKNIVNKSALNIDNNTPKNNKTIGQNKTTNLITW